MKTISVSEFRKNIKKYAELASDEKIIVNRGEGKSFLIVPLDNIEDNGYSKAFIEKILNAEKSANEGNVTRIQDAKNIWESIL